MKKYYDKKSHNDIGISGLTATISGKPLILGYGGPSGTKPRDYVSRNGWDWIPVSRQRYSWNGDVPYWYVVVEGTQYPFIWKVSDEVYLD